MNPAQVVLVSAGSAREARRLAEELVRGKWAACVTVIPGARSVYSWKGRVTTAREHLLLIKTRRSLWLPLQKRIRALHSYEVPEILALPVAGGHPAYLEWLRQETRPVRSRKSR